MNRNYVQELLSKNRIGTLIRYIEDNTYEFSVDDYMYVIKTSYPQEYNLKIPKICYRMYYYMCKFFIKRNDDVLASYLGVGRDKYDSMHCSVVFCYELYNYFFSQNNCSNMKFFIFEDVGDIIYLYEESYNNIESLKYHISKEISMKFPLMHPYVHEGEVGKFTYGNVIPCETNLKIVDFLLTPYNICKYKEFNKLYMEESVNATSIFSKYHALNEKLSEVRYLFECYDPEIVEYKGRHYIRYINNY